MTSVGDFAYTSAMKQTIALVLLSGAILSLAGCGSIKVPDAVHIPPPVIADAVYYDSRNHENVFITGEFFRMESTTPLDVVASFNGGKWLPAVKILKSSAREYRVTLPFGPEYPSVWVRVYGMNGQYSEPVRVHFHPGANRS